MGSRVSDRASDIDGEARHGVGALNEELRQLFEADQADRSEDQIDWPVVSLRDDARRRRVRELLGAAAATEAPDLYHAAMVFQHGADPEDFQKAYELALSAADLGHYEARWLAAAALDRWLMHQGKPQKYGTQYRHEGGGWKLWEVDPATADEERARWNVPPLAEARRRANQIKLVPAEPELVDPPLGALRPVARCRADDFEVWAIPAPTHELQTPAVAEFNLPPNMPVMWGWGPEDGEPALEAVTIRGRPAVLIGGLAEGRFVLIMRSLGWKFWFLADQDRESILTRADNLLS